MTIDSISVAIDAARDRYGIEAWGLLEQSERSAAIYHELCRIDSKCQRTGDAGDLLLPPCPASPMHIARRKCKLALPHFRSAMEI